jgi:hypothetical protein
MRQTDYSSLCAEARRGRARARQARPGKAIRSAATVGFTSHRASFGGDRLGIHRMSRTAAIAGIVWWFGWFGLGTPRMITAAYPTGSPLAFLWPVLLFLSCCSISSQFAPRLCTTVV